MNSFIIHSVLEKRRQWKNNELPYGPRLCFRIEGIGFLRNCGTVSVGVIQENLVLSTELIM